MADILRALGRPTLALRLAPGRGCRLDSSALQPPSGCLALCLRPQFLSACFIIFSVQVFHLRLNLFLCTLFFLMLLGMDCFLNVWQDCSLVCRKATGFCMTFLYSETLLVCFLCMRSCHLQGQLHFFLSLSGCHLVFFSRGGLSQGFQSCVE